MCNLVKTLAALVVAGAPLAQAADIALKITNIETQTGTLNWTIFDNADAYQAGEQAIASGRHQVRSDALSVSLHGLPPGTYAVRLFHDANDNGRFDKNILGLPSEGYGFSNDAGTRGPATFQDAAVQVDGDTTIEIRVR